MPMMDGYEAMRRIRAAEAASASTPVPIVVVSAHTTPLERARAVEAGADDHIGKPIQIPELLHAMDRVLQMRAAPQAATG
jgi:CheY-like chemotaxis protein